MADGPDRLATELDRIASSDIAGLHRRWRSLFREKAPESLTRSLLQRIIAYQLQADRLGDLNRETARSLDRLAQNPRETIALPDMQGTKPGALLVREWDGDLQRVMVLESGFAWNGQTFDSLSKVARAITGTNWNGPRFFGLRQKPASQGRGVQA
jgi:hypothetical protein